MSSYHERLREILVSAHQAEYSLWEGLSPEKKAQPSDMESWTAKDLIGHITGWRQRYTLFLQTIAKGEVPSRFENGEEINIEIFKHYEPKPFQEIQAEYKSATQAFMQAYDSIQETQLLNSDLIEWMSGRKLWNYIAFSEYWHPMDHLLKWYVHQDQLQMANETQARILEEMTSLEDSDSWQGTNLYNDACYQALFGDRERAVEILEKALSLNPELTEWSKQDSDLDSLRKMKAFKAIYSD
jgi:hypothetical protein